jgi:thiamine biosynthesis lipoprotein
MGVEARIVLYAASEATARDAAAAAFARIAALEDVMSDYRPSSELMRLCAVAGGPAVLVGDDLFAVLARAHALASLSDGAFDMTVGPYVRLWRQARQAGTMPPPDSLADARRRVGWPYVALDSAAQTVALVRPGMRLDLGGIAKGYAADAALAVLAERGVPQALVEIGGDLVVGAAAPEADGWVVAVPNAEGAAREQVVVHAAVSSSGDTEQYVEIAGRRYSHIVDPRTGLGLADRLAVTVIAPDGFTSDGLSTLLSVLGEREGRALLRAHFPGVRAYFRRAEL